MRTYYRYDAATGLFTGHTFGTNITDPVAHAHAVVSNTPIGHGLVEGEYDPLSQRVDLDKLKADDDAAATAWATEKDHRRLQRTAGADPGEDPPPPGRAVATAAHVIDYQPPQPSADHEWHASSKRWMLTAAAQARLDKSNAAVREIADLEKQSLTILRELAIGIPDAKDRLAEIHSQIATLRAVLLKE